MKKRRVICTILSAVFCLSLFSLGACGKKDSTIRLIVKTPRIVMNLFNQNDEYDKIETSADFLAQAGAAFEREYTKAKVEISVRMFREGEEQAYVTNAFGTEDATDVLYDDFFNMVSYAHSGNAIQLDGLLTDEARADLKPDYLEWGKISGQTYMLPFLGRQNILMYNLEIFKEYGLDRYLPQGVGQEGREFEIQNWSIEQWEDILDTLARGMAKKSEETGVQYAPVMMYAKDNLGDTYIMSLISAFSGELVDENGYFQFMKTENGGEVVNQEALKGLEWLYGGVEKGWYMPNAQAFSMNDCHRLFHDGQIAFYPFNIGSQVYIDGRNELEKYGYVNFPKDGVDEEGNQLGGATRFVTGFEIFDNHDAKKLDVAKDFVKYIYETEKWLNVSAGSISASERVTRIQEEHNMLLIKQFTENKPNVVHFLKGNPNWQGQENSIRNVFYRNIANLLAGRVTPEACAKKLNEECNKATDEGWNSSTLNPRETVLTGTRYGKR